MYELNTSWILWFHSIKDTSWTKSSYTKFYTFHNLLDYKLFEGVIQLNHLQNGMFFLMRDGIFPNWEDPDNSEGCCISFKIPGEMIKSEFCKILLHCLSEDILKNPDDWEELNGFSIAPKKEFNITKLWMRNQQNNYTNLIKELPPYLLEKDSMIKKNITN
tara:strand:- start:537 stop:1019 length:483 start_codon:yes stop_codon:yes gene_type:complete